MNLVVHTIMYGYYVFRALQVAVPRPIAMVVTSLQIVQMVFGFYVSSYAFAVKLTGGYCDIPMKTATFGFLVYVTFFCMFANLFIDNYGLRKLVGRVTCARPLANGDKKMMAAAGAANGVNNNKMKEGKEVEVNGSVHSTTTTTKKEL